MESNAVATVIKMLETLPEPAQEQVVEYLRKYLEDLHDESQWEDLFAKSHTKLKEAAQLARKNISQGKSQPLDLNRL